MTYFKDLERDFHNCLARLALAGEQGARTAALERAIHRDLARRAREARRLRAAKEILAGEPTDLRAIRARRPKGPRRPTKRLSRDQLHNKILGAWLGRAAGCMLGIPCEGMSKEQIANAAEYFAMKYPLSDYWTMDPKPGLGPAHLHYGVTPRERFLKGRIAYIGADDDLTYTLLGLLILEQYGPDFTPADVGEAWLKYLPMACTAEHVALENLKQGLKPPKTAEKNNPYYDWIGADIRSDPWGYAAPGWPEKAAEFAWRDAVVSHRMTGVHGEMFFSAAIAAAFVVDDPIEALKIGLTEIPRDCRLAKAVRSALRRCRRDDDWDKTTDAILARYDGMSMAHTLNNAELTVAGLYYGGGDFTRTIALTVMGGVDTDCTGATAGSIMGAILGAKRLPKKLIRPLGDGIESYIIGKRRWRSSAVAKRFLRVAAKVLSRDPR
ncbi:MAG: ADP-ribosylglycohydrolase family protein [Planctomycetota bacterium]